MLAALITLGVLLIALLHVWFAILEIFLWKKPLGMKTFHLDPVFAKRSAPLAANQGLYNLFLSAGLIWSVVTSNATEASSFKIFFLSCILIAGIFGALTANRKIFFIQAMPAIILLLLISFHLFLT